MFKTSEQNNHRCRNGFKRDLSKVLITILAASLLSILLAVNYFTNEFEKERVIRDTYIIGKIIGDRSISSLSFYDVDKARENLAAVKSNPSIDRLCLYAADGKLFSQYQRDGLNLETSCSEKIDAEKSLRVSQEVAAEVIEYSAGRFLLEHSILYDDELMGHLIIAGNFQGQQIEHVRLITQLIVVIFVTIIIAFLIMQLMLRRALKPLDSLFDTTILIAKNHLLAKRATKYKDDEIGALVDVFNQMLDSIEQSHADIQESEERFRTLSSSAPIGIFLMDAEFNRIYANDRWTEITGLSIESSTEEYNARIYEKDFQRVKNTYDAVKRENRKGWVEYQFCLDTDVGCGVTLMEYIAPIEKNEKQSIGGYVGSVLDVTDLRRARHELEKLAYYDPLTKLPNRRNFRDYLSFNLNKAREEGSFLALLMLDLDNFKRVNDTLGHDAGDKLLVILADRLRQRLHDDDLVARVGGDEFYVVLQDVPTLPIVGRIAKRIIEAASEPIEIKNHVIEVTVSVGVARYPLDADTSEGLMRNVDIALYKAKSGGRNQVAYFSSDLDEELKEKLRMETKLKKATMEGALELYFQPQYNAMTKSFSWCEVLLRWPDKDDGIISPFKFIPLAEETGLITEIDYWVMKSSCEKWMEHRKTIKSFGIEGLSINLSARQFFSRQLIEIVENLFKEYNIEPGEIGFEITESLLIEDVDTAITTMKSLRDIGCKLSIDDFGTGYSSLSYLKRFPLDSFKIDKSFIDEISVDEGNLAITSAIIAMAEKLNLDVIAEGIEREEQKLLLLGQGCYMMQGYYFAKPMPTDALLKGDWHEQSGHKTHSWKSSLK